MNQHYKTIFSKVHQCFVVVSELTRSHGKGSRASRVLCTLFLGACLAGVGQPAAYGASSATSAAVSVAEGDMQAQSAWGMKTKASGTASTAFGQNTNASGVASTAFGQNTAASGNVSTAFGISSNAAATNSLAALGGIVETAATNSAAIGNGAKVSVADTVALGSGSVANRAKYETTSYTAAYSENASDATTTAWRSTQNAIAVGNDATVTRQITGVAAGSADTDAVNVAQLRAAVASGGGAGTTYIAGDGIAIDDTKVVSVKAGDGLGVDNAGKLKVNTGDGLAITDNKLTVTKDGTVASGNTGIVTGGTVHAETRVSADGKYIQQANTAGQNLTALDTAVKANTDALASKADANNVYTKTEADNSFAAKNDVYTKTDADGKFATQTTVNGLDSRVTANTTALADKADKSDVYTKAQTDTALAAKADASSVYTKTETDTKLDAKADKDSVYSKTESDGRYAAKDNVYSKTESDAKYVAKGEVYSKDDVDSALSAKADADDVYTKTETDSKLDTKADKTALASVEKKADDANTAATAAQNTADAAKTAADQAVADAAAADKKADTAQSTADSANKAAGEAKTAAGKAQSTADQAVADAAAADKKADTAQSTANEAKDAVEILAGLDTEAIVSMNDRIETNKQNITAAQQATEQLMGQNGQVVEKGQAKADEFVKGETVYDYLQNRDSLALGANSSRIAIGKGSQASGNQSIAVGFGNTVTGNNSGAFGDPNTVTGNGSYAFGNNNTIEGDNIFVLGSNVTAGSGVSNAVVLGNGSTAVSNAVSVGAKGSERKIVNVAPGTDPTDAVNVSQLNATNQRVDSQDNALRRLAHRDAQLERKIYRAGAHAAAIAALHPLDYDEDHKLTASAGVGQYHGSSAMAVGAFYRPTENLMFSVGASLNENDSMVNAGMSYRFGTGSLNKTSPDNMHEMKRQISTLSEENRQLAAQLSSSETKLAAESEQSARLEAEINKIKKLLKLK